MPRPQKIEKSKDFKGSVKKLIKSLKGFHVAILVGLVLAMASSILSLVAPNRLADITDYITAGLKPNVDKLQVVNKEIYGQAISTFTAFYYGRDNLGDEQKALLDAIGTEDPNDDIVAFINLDEATLNSIVYTVIIDDVKITKEDQFKYFEIMKSMNQDMVNEDLLKKFDEMPESIYSLVKPKMDMKAIKSVSLLLLILYVLSAICNYSEQIIMALTSNKYGFKVRKSINDKINTLPLKYFDQHETGDILSRVTNDVDTMSMNLSMNLSSLIGNLTLFLGSVVMMFITSPIMAVTGILASFVGFIFMGVILKKSQKYFVLRQEQLGDLNGYIEEIYSGHNIVVAYNGIEETNAEFDKLNGLLAKSSRKSQFLSGIMRPLMGFVGNIAYVAICVVGSVLVMKGKLTFGVIVAFMIYVRMFTRPLSQIAESMTSLQSTTAAAERVFEFLDEKEMTLENDIRKHLDKSKVKGDIEFKHIKFGYDNTRTIIKDFSAKVKAGEKIALVGPTGAGKTTMVNLLMKFYDINEGDILIDGVSTKELSRENIHDLFCMVLQDTWLFDGTVGDNIRFNKENVTDAELWEVCRTLGLDHFIRTLPNGMDATVSDNDAISQGQKQLITIARGMIEDAPFLILDEATSNVDTRTEELVQKAMDKLTEGRTSFIIAHRLSTIKNADLILVMNEGNIVEQGTHEELLKKNGFYANLYNSQFEKTM
ncbi:MAG: ABC transporter ATP-binding protein [Bacilli bacterium]|nr:ABC transporter ATP-binding protein [Bacilli bacterium]